MVKQFEQQAHILAIWLSFTDLAIISHVGLHLSSFQPYSYVAKERHIKEISKKTDFITDFIWWGFLSTSISFLYINKIFYIRSYTSCSIKKYTAS